MPLGKDGSILIGTIPNSTFIDVNTPAPELEFRQEMVIPSIAGWNRYYIPLGNYFLDAVGQTTLDLNTGGGYVPQVLGVNYVNQRRGFNRPGPPASVMDAAIGFRYISGAVPAGWTFRFRWKYRKILIDSMPVAAVKLVGGSPDYSVKWNVTTVGNLPNGITVPSVPSYLVEIWRLTRHRGGLEGNNIVNNILSGGKRFVPYFRGIANQFSFDLSPFAAKSQFKFRYKVCYYNNTTGGRSQLSTDTIIQMQHPDKDDTLGSSGYIRSKEGTVWIEP